MRTDYRTWRWLWVLRIYTVINEPNDKNCILLRTKLYKIFFEFYEIMETPVTKKLPVHFYYWKTSTFRFFIILHKIPKSDLRKCGLDTFIFGACTIWICILFYFSIHCSTVVCCLFMVSPKNINKFCPEIAILFHTMFIYYSIKLLICI